MKNPIYIIRTMIEEYKKLVDENPYIILVSPKTYINIIKDIENSNYKKYLAKLKDDKLKINYIFGVPVEMSDYIIQEAICMNEKDYHKYCEDRAFTIYNNWYDMQD